MMQVFLAGNIGRDAELKDVGGTPLASFSVAVTQRIKREKVTTWVGCSIWGSRAPALAAFLNKGARVAVTGELTTRVGKENKTYLECRVSEVTLLGGGKEGGAGRPAPPPAEDMAGLDSGDDENSIPF